MIPPFANRSEETHYYYRLLLLTSAFYKIPLARESIKCCGLANLFRGVRVYACSAMDMPGSETALEELMCRVLGDLIHEGVVAKIADDVYCGADSP